MKKLVTLVMSLVLVMSLGMTFASAAGINEYEKEVLNKLSTKEVVNGKAYSFPASYITMAENFFLDYDLTEAQKDEIMPLLNDAYDIMDSYRDQLTGKNEIFAIMSASDKKALLDLAVKAGEVAELTVSYDGKVLKAVDAEGYAWLSSEPIVKITGGVDNTALVMTLSVVAVFAIAGAGLFLIKRSKAN